MLSRRSLLLLSSPVRRALCRVPDYAEEEMSFVHRSMYPKKDRILFSLANALHEAKLRGEGTRVTPEALRTMCYTGTKLPEDDIEALLQSASPPPGEDGLVDASDFVATVAKQLSPPQPT